MNARGPGENENLILLLRQMEPRPRAGCHRVALFSPEGPPARRRRERHRRVSGRTVTALAAGH